MAAHELDATLDLPIADTDTVVQAARQAQDARDWPVAAILWAQARALAPDYPLAYSEGALALREAGNPAEAEAVLIEGMARCSDFNGCFAAWGDLAMQRRDWPEAATRWADMRCRFPRDGRGYVHGAYALQHLGRMDDADRVLDEGRQAVPDDPWVMATWGYFAQHHRETEEALRRFAEIRLMVPRHPVGFVSAAILLRDRQRFQEAEAMLAGALARFPTDPQPVIDYASIAQARGDHDDAVDRWRVVRERFPEHQAGYVNAAHALRAAGRPDEAEALMADALVRFPDNPHLHIEAGWAANARGDWVAADRVWSATRRRFPGEPIPFIEGSRVLCRMERQGDADAVMEEGRIRFPNDLGIAAAWADVAMRRMDWPEAAGRWQAVRAQFPHDINAIVEGSRALQDAGRVDEADAVLADAVERFPANETLARGWAELAMRRQIWPDAARRWEAVRQRFPGQAVGFVEGARALRQADQGAAADALLDEAVDRFPGETSVRFAWAEVASGRGDWVAALHRWTIVRAQFPAEAQPWIQGAHALTQLGRTAEASDLLDEALIRHPANLDIMFNWALQAARFKAADVVHERWQLVRDTFPDHIAGYAFGAHALQDSGQPDAAEALLAEAAVRFPNDPEVSRTAAEIASRRGELGLAAERFSVAARFNPADISIVRRWIETLDDLQRHDDARDALDGALRIWPRERQFLRRRASLDIRTGRFESAYALWQSIVGMPDVAPDLGYEIAWAIFSEFPPDDMVRSVLLFLLREKDTGARDWLPMVAGLIQLRGLKPRLAHLARRIVEAEPDAPHDPATRDVLRCALLFDYTDDDIRRYLRDYVARGRVALTGHLFCQNYWKTRPGMFERFTTVFEQYLAENLRDPSWVRDDNAAKLLAYLNFAAVHSDGAYADLVRAMRGRLDLGAMQARGLHNIAGATANIALLTRVDLPAVRTENRRLRVAICVSGQLRGFQQAVPTWQHLRLEQHDVSVFVHVWKEIGRNWQRIWFFARPNPKLYDTLVGPNGLAFLRDRYPALASAAEAAAAQSNEADEPMLRAAYDTPFVRIEDDRSDRFRNRHNLWKMHYKVEQAHRLALEDGRDFDLMIRLRPDRAFLPGSAPDWNAIHAQSRDRRVVFTDSPYLFTERQTWLGDQFAVGTQDVMDVYSGVSSDMDGFTRSGAFPPDVPDHIRPHTNLFYLCFYRGLLGRMMPDVTFGALLDPAMLSVEDVLELIRRDVAGRVLDDFDRQFIAACDAALATSRTTSPLK